jgi:hypothetical protein
MKAKRAKPGTTDEFTYEELCRWACERILESLMYGRFREGVNLAIDQAVVWARRNPR